MQNAKEPVVNDGDCDDPNVNIHPSQTERYEQHRQHRCDGDVDTKIFFWNSSKTKITTVSEAISIIGTFVTDEAGMSEIDGDCNDNDSEINPDAQEYCDLVDNNCNEDIDENALDTNFFYEDSDADGYGNPDVWIQSCNASNEYVLDNTDCDDNDDQLISQIDDNDCDGVLAIDDCNDTDETTILDMDCDGIVAVDENNVIVDCDDFDPSLGDINNDNDCDGLIAIDESGVEIDCDDDYSIGK